MKSKTSSACLVFLLAILTVPAGWAVAEDHGFRLCERPCPKQRVVVAVREAGTFKAIARWTGSSDRLTLALHGPASRIYGAKTGTSPLELTVELTPEDLEDTGRWWVSVEGAEGGFTQGMLTLDLPGSGPARGLWQQIDREDFERLQRVETEDSATEPPPLPDPPFFDPSDEDNPVVRREVLDDGRPMLTYADGTRRILDEDGLTVITHHPDGRTTTPRYSQIPLADLPPDPAELAGTGMGYWLDRLADETRSTVESVLSDEEQESFFQAEANKTLYDRIDWRLDFLRFYLTGGGG